MPSPNDCLSCQGRKRHPNTKISPRIPCPNSPFLGAFNLRSSLCSASLKCRKNANTKNFEGGRGGAEKQFRVRFLWVFFSLFIMNYGCGPLKLRDLSVCMLFFLAKALLGGRFGWRGRGSPRCRQGGERFFNLKSQRGGVSGQGGGGGARGREGVCEDFGGGGGSKFFFSGPKGPPRLTKCSQNLI